MKIYTKTGDTGTTSLLFGTRVPKHHIRIESYGTVDELNSHLGLLRDQNIDQHYKSTLLEIQKNLFTIGSVMATEPQKQTKKDGRPRLDIAIVNSDDVKFLENEMDAMDAALPPMTHFILPGGHQTVSICHIARCVCRRAERLASTLHDMDPLPEEIVTYLNRLSDYLFVLARKLTQEFVVDELKWIPEKRS